MCALHRLMKLQMRNKIDYRKVFAVKQEAMKAQADIAAAEQSAVKRENERVLDLAAESQQRAAKVSPETKLTHP